MKSYCRASLFLRSYLYYHMLITCPSHPFDGLRVVSCLLSFYFNPYPLSLLSLVNIFISWFLSLNSLILTFSKIPLFLRSLISLSYTFISSFPLSSLPLSLYLYSFISVLYLFLFLDPYTFISWSLLISEISYP